MIKVLSSKNPELDFSPEELVCLNIDSDDVQNLKRELLIKARGCSYRCPYCGVKCDENTTVHEFHKSDHHWLMAFRGYFNYLEDGTKGFAFEICNSFGNITKSKWKENYFQKDSPIVSSDPAFRERINDYHLTTGSLTMSLIWDDPNDLDLHVKCPCGTHIHWNNRKCETCSGYFEKDMNRCCCDPKCDPRGSTKKNSGCSLTPIEHIYFDKLPPYGIYKVAVKLNNVYGKERKSKFKFQITETNDKITKTIYQTENEVTEEQRTIATIDFYHAKTISFLEHVQKTFNSWKNIREEQDRGVRTEYENNLKRSWLLISSKMVEKYKYSDNTPIEYKKVFDIGHEELKVLKTKEPDRLHTEKFVAIHTNSDKIQNLINLDDDFSVQAEVLMNGGHIISEYIDLIVPPGCVDVATTFSIKCVKKEVKFPTNFGTIASSLFELGPDLVKFSSPVAIRFKHVDIKMRSKICLFKLNTLVSSKCEWTVYFPKKISNEEDFIEFELNNFCFVCLAISNNCSIIPCFERRNLRFIHDYETWFDVNPGLNTYINSQICVYATQRTC